MTISERIANFISYQSESNTFLEKAANEYICALNENEDKDYVKSEFMKKAKVSGNTLDVLESIGKNERDVRLLWQKTNVVKHLDKMPIDIQKRLLDECAIEVYEGMGVRRKPISDLTEDEWKRIYSKEDCQLRDVNWQKNYVFNTLQPKVSNKHKELAKKEVSIKNKKKNVKSGKKGFSVSKDEKKVYLDLTRLVVINDVVELDYALIEKLYKAIH
jgi:hypothetical protein